jgi:hypothetical protein
MNSRYRPNARRLLLYLCILILLSWLVPSLIGVERYRHRLEAGLQGALRRPVTFGAISFRLLPRPGFVIDNVVVQEDPAFGAEPFALVDRLVCDLGWANLWRPGLDIARLRLEQPSLNIVRNARGEWNLEDFLPKLGVFGPARSLDRGSGSPRGDLGLEIADGRINLKVGADKKPIAVADVRGRLEFSASRALVELRLVGNPLRTDLSVPTPGEVELEGRWALRQDQTGLQEVRLRTRRTMLYNWIPLLTGRNPEIYGLVDLETRLSGSLRHLQVEGEATLSDLHRWEQLPPAEAFTCALRWRGQFDRDRGRIAFENVETSFADSQLRLTGVVEDIGNSLRLDLVMALERARLEDLMVLGRRLGGYSGRFGITGQAEGLLTVRGPWRERRYGGILTARDVRLATPSGSFPVSELVVRVDRRGIRLAPARLTLAPRVELVVEGLLDVAAPRPHYGFIFSVKAMPLRDLVRFGRAAGLHAVDNVDAQGIGTVTFRLAGSAWPLAAPTLNGAGELRAARVSVPGLKEPLNVPQARILVTGERVVIEPVVAVMGTSVFKGRLARKTGSGQPWDFNVHVNHLEVEEALQWFDVLGRRRNLPLIEFLPGIGSLNFRRTSVSNPFARWNAKGQFSASLVSYRAVVLKDFRSTVTIANNVVRLSGASFRTGEGKGSASTRLDLGADPVQLAGDLNLRAVRLQSLVRILPPALKQAHGLVSARGAFVTEGRSWQEWADNLQGQTHLQLEHVSFGDFDPLGALARARFGEGFEPSHAETGIRTASFTLRVRNRRASWEDQELDVSGVKLKLSGSYSFDKKLDLSLEGELRSAKRRWAGAEPSAAARGPVRLRLSGPIGRLAVEPQTEALRAAP